MMKQVIPFIKEIVFEDGLGSIVSISLEHEAFVDTDEVCGNFFVYGEYKKRLDSSEVFEFKEKIPFSLLMPDNLIKDTINVDIDDFTYELYEGNMIKVNIDLSLYGEEINVRDKDDVRDLSDIYGIDKGVSIENNINVDIDNDVIVNDNTNIINEYVENDSSNFVEENVVINKNVENDINIETNNVNSNLNNEINEVGEYVIYHIHTINEGDTLESIINKYNTNIDILKEYNDISKLEVGTKLVIPDVYYGTN